MRPPIALRMTDPRERMVRLKGLLESGVKPDAKEGTHALRAASRVASDPSPT